MFLILALGFLVSIAVTLPIRAQTVTDGDTIKMAGTTYRLGGIDLPRRGP
jgi:endonuclease YncB( thermonuclease family)